MADVHSRACLTCGRSLRIERAPEGESLTLYLCEGCRSHHWADGSAFRLNSELNAREYAVLVDRAGHYQVLPAHHHGPLKASQASELPNGRYLPTLLEVDSDEPRHYRLYVEAAAMAYRPASRTPLPHAAVLGLFDRLDALERPPLADGPAIVLSGGAKRDAS